MSLLACLLVLGAAWGFSVFLWNPWPGFALAEIFEFLEKSKTISWWFQFLNELLLQHFPNLLVKIHFVLEQPTFKAAASSCSPFLFTSDLCRRQSNAIKSMKEIQPPSFYFFPPILNCYSLEYSLLSGRPSGWGRISCITTHMVFKIWIALVEPLPKKKQLSKPHFFDSS